jgi:hypothetical protein
MKLKFGNRILQIFGFSLVLGALANSAWAVNGPAPEMDPGLATSALALLGGGLAMIAGRRRPK